MQRLSPSKTKHRGRRGPRLSIFQRRFCEGNSFRQQVAIEKATGFSRSGHKERVFSHLLHRIIVFLGIVNVSTRRRQSF